MLRSSALVLFFAISVLLAVSTPVGAQSIGPIGTTSVAIPPPVNSYDVSARNMVRLVAACGQIGNYCFVSLSSELANSYTVPQGKRLVITGYSAQIAVPTGSIYSLNLSSLVRTIYLDLHQNGTDVHGHDVYIANGTAVNFYVDQGESLYFQATTNTGFTFIDLQAWGYLVDCTGGICMKG